MAILESNGITYMCKCGDHGLSSYDICISCGWCIIGCCPWEGPCMSEGAKKEEARRAKEYREYLALNDPSALIVEE